ncbi:MAG: AI-2E family transporter [Pseudohongiellaceae bacterium]
MKRPDISLNLVNFTMVVAIVALSAYLLIVGQDLLLPLVIAIAFWYLINVLASGFARLTIGGRHLPRPLCFAAAILSFLAGISFIVQFVSGGLEDLGGAARQYETNLLAHWENLPFAETMPVEGFTQLLGEQMDLSGLFAAVALSFTGIAADSLLILIYTGFLLFEQGNFDEKLSALVAHPARERQVRRIIGRIRADTRKFISIKLFTSVLTGTLSYLLLRFWQVDFAEVWAVLIFLLNFIPTVGSIIATLFPALVALAQSPDGLALSLLVLLSIGSLQVLIGNIIEPRLMGTSLNLSPVVILFNLALWGYMWGIAGMFLCVPFLIIITIVLANFPRTRPIAILLSSNGQVDIAEEVAPEPPVSPVNP